MRPAAKVLFPLPDGPASARPAPRWPSAAPWINANHLRSRRVRSSTATNKHRSPPPDRCAQPFPPVLDQHPLSDRSAPISIRTCGIASGVSRRANRRRNDPGNCLRSQTKSAFRGWCKSTRTPSRPSGRHATRQAAAGGFARAALLLLGPPVDEDVLPKPCGNDRLGVRPRAGKWNPPHTREFRGEGVPSEAGFDQVPRMPGGVVVGKKAIRIAIEQQQPSLDRKPPHRRRGAQRVLRSRGYRLGRPATVGRATGPQPTRPRSASAGRDAHNRRADSRPGRYAPHRVWSPRLLAPSPRHGSCRPTGTDSDRG